MINDDSYKERFIQEYIQLKERYNKLKWFIRRVETWTVYDDLANPVECKCPLDLLNDQLYAMNEYLAILEKRSLLEGISLEECNTCAIQNESGRP